MNEFDPVVYSDKENEFLLENLGKPAIVALRSPLPSGVNLKAVKPVFDRVRELEELQTHEGVKWVGVDAIKKSIETWLKTNSKWGSDARRNKRAPRWPSLHSFDAKGKAHRAGPGSDSDRIRTYFGPAGERIPFALTLVEDYIPEWVAPGFTEQSMEADLFVDAESHRIECRVPVDGSICGHTESYKAESRASYNAARARMSKHLRKATKEVETHRTLYTNEFGS